MSRTPFSPLLRPLGFECYPSGLGPSRRAFLQAVAHPLVTLAFVAGWCHRGGRGDGWRPPRM